MNTKIKPIERVILGNVFLVLFGFITGFIFSIGIKYPLKYSEIDKASQICAPNSSVEQVTITVVGAIYTVTCKNSTVYFLKH